MDITLAKSVAAREDEGITLHLKDQNGVKEYYGEGENKKPVTVRVAGSYSARARRAREASRDQMFQRRGNVDGEEAAQLDREVLAACVMEWDGLFANGQPFPLSTPNALALLEQVEWYSDQIRAAHNNHAAFSKGA